MRIELHELLRRENEQVEWNEQVADPEDVVATLVAFANDLANLGGGYVVCGAKEERDEHGFQTVRPVGLTGARMRELEGRVLSTCRERVHPPLHPVLEELPGPTPDTRLMVWVMPASGAAHVLRATREGSRYFVRIGRETREARNGLLLELLSRKGVLPPWDRRHPPEATEADVDLLALRDALSQLDAWPPERDPREALVADRAVAALAPALCAAHPLTRALRPRNLTLLLFGREPQRFFPDAHVVLSVYPGVDRSDPVARRYELAGTLIHQAKQAIALLDLEAHTVFDKDDPARPNRLRYPPRALREALVNALVHRDYAAPHPVRVTAFADRVEVHSPGGIDRSLDAEDLGRGAALPVWRNQGLAWFLNRLQIAQAEGQGVAAILRAMRENGNPPPRFQVTEASVTCTLPAHPGTSAPAR